MNAAEPSRARRFLSPFSATLFGLQLFGRLATLLVGLMVIAIGAGVVGGWLTERPDLVRLWCPGPAMRFNTALLAILCGCALVALSARQYRAMQLLGGFAALGAGVSALQNVLGVSLGIDELFYKNHQSAEELAGARMSLNAAICFMLLGTGFVLVRRPGHQQWRFFVAALLASAAMAVAIIDFLGIATGMTVELGWAGTYGMSVPSTIVITLCAISLLAVAARFHTHQGASLAKWFPLLVGNSAIVATFVLWLALQFQDYERIRKTVRAQFDNLDAALNYSLRHHEGVVMRIAKRWDVAGGSTEVAWREDAKNYLQALRGFEALAWVDTGLVVRQFEEREPCRLAETIADNVVVREMLLAARQQQVTLATILIKPTNGDTEVWLMQPLLNAGVDDGCMLAVLDLTRLMPSILERAAMQGQTITLGDHERVLYESPAIADGYDAGLSQSVDLKFANLNWTATAVPSRRWVDSQRSALPDLTLGAGVLFSLLLTIMLRLAVWARDSYRQATLSEARFRAIFESADRAIIAASTDGVIQAFNAAAERMLGYTAEEMIGQQTPEIIHLPSEMRSRAEELTAELGRRIEPGMEVFTARPSSGEIEEREWTYVRKDGSVLPVLLSVTASRDKHNAITGFMGIANDITQQRQAQQELREAREAAVQASRAKSEFLANMSHEIRTPMNGIIGMTELALVTKLSTDQREYLETIKESADSLLTVVNDILDFSKVEAGMLHLETIDFDLPAKLNAVIRALTTRAGEKGLELTCQFDPEVPTWVAGDPDRLRQVIVNLAGNAIKFTDGGEVSVGVRLQEAPVDGEKDCLLHFTVRDTGIGIPADKQRVIFDAFAQADSSTTRRFGGTGLGLTISARLVALMGGQIWVESTVGEGSTFHFTARFKVSDVATPVRAAEQLAALKDMRVLVVDDNATNRLVLHDMLVNWKMCPVLTASGREALSVAHAAAARGERFPLILVDYLMPEMDGVQLIELIHDSPSLAGAKIVLLTSVSDRLHTERCRQLNIAGFLRKPLNQSTLLDELLEAMSSHAADALAAAEGNSPCGADADKTETPAKAQKLDLLLVEDNRINQRVAMRMLDLQGHRVTLADSGARALAILEQHEFDGVLMDLQMPDMDGFETTAEIRRREAGGARRLPIIAMTAHALKGDRERCLEAGMDGYVSKPVSAEELRRALASIQPKCVPAGEYDIADAIKRVDGDLEFLGQLAVMLEEDAPGALAGIGAAIESRNARQLERVAHQLKGSLAPFAAAAAIHSAQALENAGRDEEFVEAPAELDRLKLEVERLLSALANLRSASASTSTGGASGETAKRQGDRSCTT